MKKMMVLLLLLAFGLTGCAGTVNRKVYQFDKDEGDKWVKEIVVIVLVAVPAYGLSSFNDAVVFNSVELWSGKKTVAAKGVKPVMIGQGQKGVALLLFDNVQRMISLQILQGQTRTDLTFTPGPAGVVAKDAQGEVQFSAMTTIDGSVSVYDREGHLLQSFSPEQVAALAGKKS